MSLGGFVNNSNFTSVHLTNSIRKQSFYTNFQNHNFSYNAVLGRKPRKHLLWGWDLFWQAAFVKVHVAISASVTAAEF